MNKTDAILRAHAHGEATTYRQACNATGLSLKVVMGLSARLRDRGVLRRVDDTYPARNVITAAGRAVLQDGEQVDPVNSESIVQSALRHRTALTTVWSAQP